jgi:DNA repair photolyase
VPKSKTGTREWAEKTVNIQRGCANGCRYCYARANALRFGQIAEVDEWLSEKINDEQVHRSRGKSQGRIMFPSTHDITPANVVDCVIVLRKLARAGNELLIVSKPRLDCVRTLLESLEGFKRQITLRFTIGAMDDTLLAFWEPFAPLYAERRASLELAFKGGWKTSVSVEPMLDAGRVVELVEDLQDLVSDVLWIGKMNQVRRRFHPKTPDEEVMIGRIEASQTDERIWAIYNALKDNPKVRWKDSIKQVVGLAEEE